MANDSPTPSQLLAIIKTQTEIAKLGIDLHAVMTLVAEQAQTITGATGAVVELAEDDDMVYHAVAGSAAGQLGLRLSRHTSLSGKCVASGKPLRCDDSETDPRVDRDACRRVGLRSMIVVPLIHGDVTVGALKVLSRDPAAFGEPEIKVLGLMSDLIAAAMFHATKYGANELFQMATRDNLTGLANRALFYDRLRHALARAKRESRRMGVLMLDMDGLKPINDRHGHRAGDAALKEMARRIAASARQADTVARLGGDEFAFVLSEVADRDGIEEASKRISAHCEQAFSFEDVALPIGVSIGAALFPDDGDQLEVLIDKADQIMYAVKRERKRAAGNDRHPRDAAIQVDNPWGRL